MAQKNETRRIRRYDLLPVVTVDGFVCLPISFLANCVREKKKNGGRVGRQEDETCVTSECQEDEEASVEMVSSCLRTLSLSLSRCYLRLLVSCQDATLFNLFLCSSNLIRDHD